MNFVAGYDFSNTQIPEQDTTVGNLLQISVVQSPTYAKAWNRFGNWCYSWGRAVLDRPSSSLTPEDKEIIDGFIPADIANKEIVYKILTHNKPKHDEEDIEVGPGRKRICSSFFKISVCDSCFSF